MQKTLSYITSKQSLKDSSNSYPFGIHAKSYRNANENTITVSTSKIIKIHNSGRANETIMGWTTAHYQMYIRQQKLLKKP